MKIINLLCDSQDNGLTVSAAKRLADAGYDIDVWQFGTSDIDANEMYFVECCRELKGCTLVIIRVHAGLTYFKKFERLRDEIRRTGVSLLVMSEMPQDVEENHGLFHYSQADERQLRTYLEFGGPENEYNMLAWLMNRKCGVDIIVGEPERTPSQGLYEPRKGMVQEVPMDKSLPTVAVVFNQMNYVSKDLAHIDSLIDAIRAKGANAMPLFVTSSPNDIIGSIGIAGSFRKYLMDGDKSIVDAIILNLSFSQLCLSDPSDGSEKAGGNVFDEIGVPVIQATTMFASEQEWCGNISGLAPFELSMSVFWPEYDGQIISVPLASAERTKEGRTVCTPISDRVMAIADLAVRWAVLRRTPAEKRKIAILLHQNPPRNDMIGGAFGLDAQESTSDLLRKLRAKGYSVNYIPRSGQELTERILSGVTNNSEWLDASEMKKRAAATVSKDRYLAWFSATDPNGQKRMMDDWGKPPGELCTVDGVTVIPGMIDGNVFIGLQPNRGMTEDCVDIYHSQDITPPHNYLCFYRWLIDDFGAQAVIHMGCHGTLEWLPGKGTGLSSKCFPDLVFGHVPHIYPYAISNPGEGMHAKRRNGAVIVDHLIPSMTRSGTYDELSDVEALLQEYLRAGASGSKEKQDSLLEDIRNKCSSTSLLDDIGMSTDCTLDELRPKAGELYDYLSEVKDSIIKDGLHVLGRSPANEKLDEMIYAIVRMQNGSVPSLRTAVAVSMGLDLETLQNDPSATNIAKGKLNGELIDDIDGACACLIHRMRVEADFDCARSEEIAVSIFGHNEGIDSVVGLICESIVPGLAKTSEETDNVIGALDGRYVLPGPSGCITRGNAHLLPSGRNFYSIDPASIPARSSWNVGVRMAEQMIERHVKEAGSYPRQVGIVIWATDTMKTGGDDIAYVMYLLGVMPVWAANGSAVTGLKVIPVKDLGRPRIDVTLRISGLFRDSFPNLIEMLDDAVRTISELDESDDENYLLSHLRRDITESVANGLDPVIARRRARVRIFGDPPGNYGAGVDALIEKSQWKDKNELADAYVEWGGYAYGGGFKGEDLKDCFRKRMKDVDVTVKNHESRELDAFDNDDDYVFLGGMNAAVEQGRGVQPISVMGDSSDPDSPRIRTLSEESKFIFRSRVLNPKWVNGLKEHGYRGVQELSNLVDFSFGWDSTSGVMEDWMYQAMTDRFIFDGENRQWIKENNPDALMQMTSRLLEAVERGMWKADKDTVDRLKSIYADTESTLESINDR
jgi:cobaltochelatase CobN